MNEDVKEVESGIQSLNISAPTVQSLASTLVDSVRAETGISYNQSQNAVKTVLSILSAEVPGLDTLAKNLVTALSSSSQQQEDDSELVGSGDGQALHATLADLRRRHDDSQQRSWSCHDDEADILGLLDTLMDLLSKANPEVSRAVLARGDWAALDALASFFQMDTRASIRQRLLYTLSCVCELDARGPAVLLLSPLPPELARTSMVCYPADAELYCSVCCVLTEILASTPQLPVHFFQTLDQAWAAHQLSVIEEDRDSVSDAALSTLLALNLHVTCDASGSGLVLAALLSREGAPVLIEKLLHYVNRLEEPVAILPHARPAELGNSVVKLLQDIFTRPETAGLMYTTDLHVLIGVLLRQVDDLDAGDKVRTESLSLLHLVVKNSGYLADPYMLPHLTTTVDHVEQEEPGNPVDKFVAAEIRSELGQKGGGDC